VQRLADLVIEQERRASRAARRLHDDAGPALTGIGFQLGALGLSREQTADIREAPLLSKLARNHRRQV
jgi:signal transduction histidine kinase